MMPLVGSYPSRPVGQLQIFAEAGRQRVGRGYRRARYVRRIDGAQHGWIAGLGPVVIRQPRLAGQSPARGRRVNLHDRAGGR